MVDSLLGGWDAEPGRICGVWKGGESTEADGWGSNTITG